MKLVRSQKDFYFYFLSHIRTGHIFNSPGDTLINSACLCERFAHCAAGLSASSDSVNYSRGEGERWRGGELEADNSFAAVLIDERTLSDNVLF